MKLVPTLLFAVCLAATRGASEAGAADTAPLVGLEKGRLVYRAQPDGDRIPDFSNCGFRGGGVALPEVPVRASVEPRAAAGDDTERIQTALDEVSARALTPDGFRGAVLLKAGTYRVAGTLRIGASGVVLRGAGPEEGGTLIVATGTRKRTLIQVGGGRPGAEIEGSRRAVADARVPVGARSFRLVSTEGLAPGDPVVVFRPATAEWIHTLGTDRLNRGPDDKVKNWSPSGYRLGFERFVAAVEGDTITLDAPLVLAIDAAYGGGAVYKTTPDGRIRLVGVEQLRLVSEYAKGKEDSDEAHAWDAVKIGPLTDGWVRKVTAVHFGYSCVNITSGGKRITVQDCACLDPVSRITGGRRYSFALDGQLCLVQRCYTRGGRHDYVMHARARGPNVFLDCVADRPHADSGPHHRWATGTLYDNIACGALNVQWRGRSGTGHGWAGANMVFWNCRTRGIICQKPPTADNYGIGCTGTLRGDGHIESPGKPVRPRSLYLQQLEERLGPEAIRNVAAPEQLRGPLDEHLGARFGHADGP